MQIEKPKLFLETKDFLLVALVLVFATALRFWLIHISYEQFVSKPFIYTDGIVLNSYQKTKHDKRYTVLKIRDADGLLFFTSTNNNIDFASKILRMRIYPSPNISFLDYIGHFYIKSDIISMTNVGTSVRNTLSLLIDSQHQSKWMQSFYNGIYLATPIESNLREKISILGISHLVALSGFHLGILSWLIFTLLKIPYKVLQKRYFAYRYDLIDVGLLTMFILAYYLWITDFPPSLIRSYTMVLVGWIAILLGIELVSFRFLTIVTLMLVLLFPSLLLSIGFALSVTGVFYIFLLLLYDHKGNNKLTKLLIIPFGIYILMSPIVHIFFGVTSIYQLLSPLLSLLFAIFYPLSIILHLVGMGSALDTSLMWLFDLATIGREELLPTWLALLYLSFSILAIWHRVFFILTFISAICYMIYLYMW